MTYYSSWTAAPSAGDKHTGDLTSLAEVVAQLNWLEARLGWSETYLPFVSTGEIHSLLVSNNQGDENNLPAAINYLRATGYGIAEYGFPTGLDIWPTTKKMEAGDIVHLQKAVGLMNINMVYIPPAGAQYDSVQKSRNNGTWNYGFDAAIAMLDDNQGATKMLSTPFLTWQPSDMATDKSIKHYLFLYGLQLLVSTNPSASIAFDLVYSEAENADNAETFYNSLSACASAYHIDKDTPAGAYPGGYINYAKVITTECKAAAGGYISFGFGATYTDPYGEYLAFGITTGLVQTAIWMPYE